MDFSLKKTEELRVQTLVDLLSFRSEIQPDTIAYTFLTDGEDKALSYSYQQLDVRSRAIASTLQSLHLAGERVLLLYAPGLAFLEAFFGCLYAGAIAVPAFPPRKNRSSERINSIIVDAEAKAILTEESIYQNSIRVFNEDDRFRNMEWVISSAIPDEASKTWTRPDITENTIAFLQYTSGSTGSPKGVIVTHGNILHNEKLIKESFSHSSETVFVGWLPLYHDMGLIGNVLQPLYLGIHCVLMAPVAFLQKPVRWLKAISKYKGTTGGAPNFAYELCINKITDEQMEGVDLSSWDLAYNGSEPIRADTLERFAQKFGKYGFRKEAFYPCYGMAEVTLFATGGDKYASPVYEVVDSEALKENKIVNRKAGEQNTSVFVSCGRAWLDLNVKVVNPETCVECMPDEVGEIWIAGKSVSQGYWNKAELTEKTFHTYTVHPIQGPYLRTGDLGFYRNGHLFITGRIKDLIIIRGKNLYPHDIELTAERSHVALRPGCGAVFSVLADDEEQLVVVHEVDHQYQNQVNLEELEGTVRQAIVRDYDVNPLDIVFIRHLSLPKTSSGKIQRFLSKKQYLEDSLERIAAKSLEVG
jgi:acyl-CoA synthetase (AMP-forming)/AMP-acid ligase II